MSRDPNETLRKAEKPAMTPEVPSPENLFDFGVTVARYQKWFPDLEAQVLERLAIYTQELLRFNKTVNLISATTIKSAESVHFADSVLAARLIYDQLLPAAPLYDFGSGNGLPGLVFGLMYPKLKVILIDRDQRKLEFCKHVGATLKLSNLSVQVSAVEDLKDSSVHNVVGRGFAPLSRALLMARKPVAKGGRFFHMKGDGWANELAQVPSQLFTHWSPSLIGQYRIPEATTEMSVVLTTKNSD